ncbi:two-pore potassium channel 5-like isoform X2 [Cornus florida]|uniref:two-pore potassium channel 5-like isoform X2 n=1 Tax=Cornus florida TaxID=4283 RepID=UPI002897BD9E|nr:two-pore potassium channel 5-like isoform X2 [Cornus florida]
MESEPFLASEKRPQLEALLDYHDDFSFVRTTSSSSSFNTPVVSPSNPMMSRKIHRCKTAPAIAVMRDLKPQHNHNPNSQSSSEESTSGGMVRQAALLLLLYLSLGVLIYSFNRDNFSGVETHPVVDALYFCIVTMCTIGYGDIAPLTPATKLFSCFFVLVGFGFIDILLSGVVNYVLDLQESMILRAIRRPKNENQNQFDDIGFGLARNYIVDVEKGRMRIRLKVCLALGVVVLSIGMGTLVLYFVEDLDWIDSIYLSVMSVTTVGYGDRAFKTLPGRLFAAIWLLFSTLAVARAFLYLAEARIDKRHRRITKWVLHRDITVEDLLAADINNNGFISASFWQRKTRHSGEPTGKVWYLVGLHRLKERVASEVEL